MKKKFAILTVFMVTVATFTANAQVKKAEKPSTPSQGAQLPLSTDTTKQISFHQSELGQMYINVDSALSVIHRQHIDALLRDKIDRWLLYNQGLTKRRIYTTLDTTKAVKKN